MFTDAALQPSDGFISALPLMITVVNRRKVHGSIPSSARTDSPTDNPEFKANAAHR
jgi:hypothetical protein